VRSIRYKGPIFKWALAVFVVSFLILGYLGVATTDVWGKMPAFLPIIGGVEVATIVSRVLTLAYFGFFLLMPWYSAIDKCKPEPERVTA
jgi:ubiquinol-cytochrome c reductase cytochrome b subunit